MLFSKVNTHFQILYGERLQETAPNLKRYLNKLKSEGDAPRKALPFTVDQMRSFCTAECTSGYMLVRVTCATLMFFGGMRSKEAKDLKMNSVTVLPDGAICVNYEHAKQRDPSKRSAQFLIPRTWGSNVITYINRTAAHPRESQFLLTGDLHKFVITSKVLGINQVYQAPKYMATWLGLPNPDKYTGHAWRRSAAQALADGGDTSSHIVRHMGWTGPQMLNAYTAVSTQSQLTSAGILSGNLTNTSPTQDE